MKNGAILFLIAFLLVCCKRKEAKVEEQTAPEPPATVATPVKTLKIFAWNHRSDTFVVKINDDFEYRHHPVDSTQPWTLVKEYGPVGDSINVYLKIAKNDTSFVYDVKDVDSIMIHWNLDYTSFYIRNEHHIWAWVRD